MKKKDVIDQIQNYLANELANVVAAADAAREAATHEESKAEDAHDTRAIEAGYLAAGQAKRVDELKGQLLMYKFLPVREYGPEDVACPAALVELEHNSRVAFYFIAPKGGGLITEVDGKPVQVITPASPLGDALMGKRVGDIVEVESRGVLREYRVISIR